MPITNTIINVVISLHHFDKQVTQEVIVRCFLETKFPDIIKVNSELLCAYIRYVRSSQTRP